jgi:hypothetical protein
VEYGVVPWQGAMWIRRGFGGKEGQSDFAHFVSLTVWMLLMASIIQS